LRKVYEGKKCTEPNYLCYGPNINKVLRMHKNVLLCRGKLRKVGKEKERGGCDCPRCLATPERGIFQTKNQQMITCGGEWMICWSFG